MKVQQQRRERLFKAGKPVIRAMVPDDMRWLWAAARRAGNTDTQEAFQQYCAEVFGQSDRQWILADRNAEFRSGSGPVGLVMAVFDGWTLMPHVEWFMWATPRNKLRCSVGFLQTMRYARDTGSIKLSTEGETNRRWFKGLRRYLPIAYAGAIPNGRPDGTEYIFYLRGRKHHGRSSGNRRRTGVGGQSARAGQAEESESVVPGIAPGNHPETSPGLSADIDRPVTH